MPISRTTIAGGLAGAVLLLSAGVAMATPGQATATVNVRSGPGTSYGIVDSLSAGESVDVQQCRGSWCFVEHSGPDGWVSANFLATGEDDRAPPPVYYDDQPPPVYYDEPEYYSSPEYYGPIYQHRPYYQHRRPPFDNGFPPPNGQNPPPHHSHNPPGTNSGNQGPFGMRTQGAPQRAQQDPCVVDPAQCQAPQGQGPKPFGMR